MKKLLLFGLALVISNNVYLRDARASIFDVDTASVSGQYIENIDINPFLIVTDGSHTSNTGSLTVPFKIYNLSRVRYYIVNNGISTINYNISTVNLGSVEPGKSVTWESVGYIRANSYNLKVTNTDGSRINVNFRVNQLDN